MADGILFKPDKDFTKEADTVIPEAQEVAKVWNLQIKHWKVLIARRKTYRKASTRFSVLRSKQDRYIR